MRGEAKLTKAQRRLLQWIADRQGDIFTACDELELRQFTVSRLRNDLWAAHLIESWPDYASPMRIAPAGRAALEAKEMK